MISITSWCVKEWHLYGKYLSLPRILHKMTRTDRMMQAETELEDSVIRAQREAERLRMLLRHADKGQAEKLSKLYRRRSDDAALAALASAGMSMDDIPPEKDAEH